MKEEYLKTLTNGTYNVEIEFTNGDKLSTPLVINVKLEKPETTKPIVVETPSIDGGNVANGGLINTGDTTNTTIPYTMLIVSLLGLVVAIKSKRKTEE